MLPTVRRAGMSTEGEGCLQKKTRIISTKKKRQNHSKILKYKTYIRSSTRRGQTPTSVTACILSFVPSDKYESAQQASVRTSSSFE